MRYSGRAATNPAKGGSLRQEPAEAGDADGGPGAAAQRDDDERRSRRRVRGGRHRPYQRDVGDDAGDCGDNHAESPRLHGDAVPTSVAAEAIDDALETRPPKTLTT